MNQDTPPPGNPNQDPKPNEGAAPERVERPSRPGAPEPHAEALAGWEEPQPEIGEAEGRSSGRWDEPEPHVGGPRWEEPRPSGGQYGKDGTREPRRRHPAEEHIFSKRTWLRLVFIVIFAVAWWIAEFVLTAVIVIQFLWVLFTGLPNERLRSFGQSLSRYAYQLFRYMTFNSDERPFPFDLDWPSGAPDSTSR
jgi:hypothetical protein